MNCLNSITSKKHEGDPDNGRLIVMWSCDNCAEEGDDVEFYDYNMRKIETEPTN